MRLIYLAGRYRAPTRDGIKLNIQLARAVGIMVAQRGLVPVIPHAMTAHFDALDPRIGDQFWLDATLALMRRCDAVLMLPGWQDSAGAVAEREEATLLGMPVFYDVVELTAFAAGVPS